jgi:Fic family protein
VNAADFTESAPGSLIRIDTPVRDWAFVPHELPPDWEFPSALWPYLADAREALGTLDGIGLILPDPNLLLRPLQSREAITSSSIEGTHVTPAQLLLYEIDPHEHPSSEDKEADWMEVSNYSQALRKGRELIDSSMPIGEELIKSVHEILMRGVRGRDKTPGQYRQKHVHVGTSLRFVPPPHKEVPRLMENLFGYTRFGRDSVHPIVKACIAHYQFEAIHPFLDGNGRIGRLLISLMLYKWLDHSQPWLYLSAYLERYRDEYIRNMFRVSTHGDWANWLEFCLRGVTVQARDAVKRCQLFRSLRKKFDSRVTKLTARTTQLIDWLFVDPVVTITAVSKKLQTSYNTARSDLDSLVSAGILTELEGAYPKAFWASEIVHIAYSQSVADIEVTSS